ncbi:TetR family transcriptional regulator [Ciceribacter naphthalenivorans]|uniref:TetR family transcriptional regulator n=3 Tax=Pseudomonadota TaxID=1224 RepID=A0A512HKR8_9HYPH|nr:TetR family transcriptional regulator [Ciceribacter naphthalenivorans]GLR22135.1 TetR family transcriptional regulator [Ciceribacter naphthalenivorans]GLT04991.1 TetR family transcriptional regulator [Sphingomonas psychrolutea]
MDSHTMAEKARKRRDPEERRAEILAAAFSLFSERGFAATRIEDIATRAGIAKGTVYLHFPDKEALFTSLAAGMASPILARMSAMTASDAMAPKTIIAGLYALAESEILGTDRRHMLRLLISEGQFFPVVAEFYHRNVLSVGLGMLRQVLQRAAERGELRNPALAAMPQLIFAPILMSVIWKSLFEPYEHLDTKALFETFLETLFLPSEGEDS